ncbi:hypothetical protein EWB00_004477 [Schistosoma japonicum]|uniref:Uncharacterized protein n=1 Tax=Schistosoma japonicum TaxID=6182 RepID=A0A4Z2D522_SCHJA|nr:hypothetical protein EWB00_004477 [Schistosoma japonicum]
MNFTSDNTDNIEYNLLQSSCTTTVPVDGIYFDETESMINHARSSPMNASDVVEITTIYSIINDSQESIPHHYEDNDDEQEEKIKYSNNERPKKLFRKIASGGKNEGSMMNSPDGNHILSEKDLLNS